MHAYRIGFDAKRAYHNTTGLGHYSRTLIQSLATCYPEHQYYLLNPKPANRLFTPSFTNVFEIQPKRLIDKLLRSFWRSNSVKKELIKYNIQLYHGLSHEIPMGIQRTNICSVVTIHDLIFERYPHQYNPIDVQIYRFKFKNACKHADKIIAISKQTKEDIIHYYGIHPDKIEICYQSCNVSFSSRVDVKEIDLLKQRYGLPQNYFLYVGSIIERKNLLVICKAMQQLGSKLPMPLVVIGNGTGYKKKIQTFIQEHHLENKIIFLSDNPIAKKDFAFKTAQNFPALYQGATAVIYPSIFEGFGIPVLEALWSKVPVITSKTSCLPETGGNAAYYVDPYSTEEMANAMLVISSDVLLRANMVEKGWTYAQQFTYHNCATAVMNVYKNLL